MGRTAFGVGNVLKVLIELLGNSAWVEEPVERLKAKTGLGEATVKKYLHELAAGGYVKFVYGSHYHIKRLSVEKKETQELFVIPSLKPPTPVAAVPAPIPATFQPADAFVVALVDYDNVTCSARDCRFALSFEKLRELIRGFGKVLFADAYISQANNRPEIVARLSKADFRVIACPQGYKDKDSVDEKMKGDARKLLQCAPVNKIIIVSRDSDFHDLAGFAADLHKEVAFIDVEKNQEKLTGYDEAPKLVQSRSLERFTKALEHLKSDWSGLNSEEEKCVRFLKEIILAVREKERKTTRDMPFKTLHQYIWRENYSRWGKIWTEYDLQKAMSALVDNDAIRKNVGAGRDEKAFQFYTLNNYHKAVIKVLESPKN